MRLNSFNCVGRLAADPTYTKAKGDTQSQCRFRLIVNRIKTKAYDVLPITTWGKLADACAASLTKGKEIAVEGEVRTNSVKKEDGSYDNYWEIRAGRVNFGANSAKSQREESSVDAIANAIAAKVKAAATAAKPESKDEAILARLLKIGLSKEQATAALADYIAADAKTETSASASASTDDAPVAADTDVPF